MIEILRQQNQQLKQEQEQSLQDIARISLSSSPQRSQPSRRSSFAVTHLLP